MNIAEPKRPLRARIVDFLTGRSEVDRTQIVAETENIQVNDKQITKSLDRLVRAKDAAVSSINEFSLVVDLVVRDFGHLEPAPKVKHAKTAPRNRKK